MTNFQLLSHLNNMNVAVYDILYLVSRKYHLLDRNDRKIISTYYIYCSK